MPEEKIKTGNVEFDEILGGGFKRESQIFFDAIDSDNTDKFMNSFLDSKISDKFSVVYISANPPSNLEKFLGYENFYLICINTQHLEQAKVSENSYIVAQDEVAITIEDVVSKLPLRKTIIISEISSFIVDYGMLAATETVENLIKMSKNKLVTYFCLFYNNKHPPFTTKLFDWKFKFK